MNKRHFSPRRILYLQYTNPAVYPPLEHSSRILAQRGWEVLFLGIEVTGVQRLQFPPHPRIAVRKLLPCPPGWFQKLHYLGYCLWVMGWAVIWRPRWIYASEPLAALPGLFLAWFFPTVYHEHDWPSCDGAPSFFFRWVLSARRRMARRAQLCVIPNEERARRFKLEMGTENKVRCVWNCPAREEISPPRPPCQKQNLWLTYQGSLVPSRLPIALFEALSLLPRVVKLRVIGYETIGHRAYLKRLRDKTEQLGIVSQVEFVGTLPTRRDLLEYCRRSNVGLAFMPRESPDVNDHTMTGASNKPFDYLACGTAVLVSSLPDWEEMFVEPGFGLACNPEDPKSIAQALRWFLEHPAQMREMGEKGRRRILEEWNYEKQFSSVLERLDAIDR